MVCCGERRLTRPRSQFRSVAKAAGDRSTSKPYVDWIKRICQRCKDHKSPGGRLFCGLMLFLIEKVAGSENGRCPVGKW